MATIEIPDEHHAYVSSVLRSHAKDLAKKAAEVEHDARMHPEDADNPEMMTMLTGKNAKERTADEVAELRQKYMSTNFVSRALSGLRQMTEDEHESMWRLDFGKALDRLELDPDDYNREYTVWPDMDR